VAEDVGKVYRSKQVAILPNGIDPRKWQVPHLMGDQFTIVSVMRLCNSKQPQRLIRAIPRINQQLSPHQKPVFLIIGDGSQRNRIKRLIKRYKIQNQVQLLGRCSRNQIKTEFIRAQLFVLPSIYEGFGIAALEARAAGIPVIAMNQGGVRDIVQHGVDGFLADDDEAFADQIAEFIRNSELRSQIEDHARQALDRMTWDDVIARHMTVYQAAISQHPATLEHKEGAHEGLLDRRYGT
jgi:glycosyltransferase involved in cell wall biosynthesis